jgi:D-inositol-3-phosphate glycosyltransferase
MSDTSIANIESQATGVVQEKGSTDRPPLKVLAWADSAIAGTGFGVVSRHVLQAVHATGKYEIHHLAINHHGDFVNSKEIPWQMQPARLMDPRDPHGIKMFLKTVMKGNYDIVWILNDIYVTNEVTAQFHALLDQRRAKGLKNPVSIYYYPVDCHVPLDGSSFLPIVDIPVCYTDHGRAETLKTHPSLEPKLFQVPHGVDSHIFKPLPRDMVMKYKSQLLRSEKESYLIINVNRNSSRKQIQYSMLAFKEFKKRVPNAVMYIHSAVMDQGGDLRKAVLDLGMDPRTDIVFPVNYSPSNPVTPATLNMLYNMADMYLTTHLGEGWGLTVTEAMAAGVPVVAPDNTCMPQQLGENSERGYIYPCNDMIWIDPSGYRLKGLIPDIVEKMIEVYRAGPKDQNQKVKLALEWAREHDWKNLHGHWVDIFEHASALASGSVKVDKITTGEVL